MKNKFLVSKIIIYCVIFILLFLYPSFAHAGKNLRSAKISELSGEVSVIRAGGEKAIKAFKNMSLSQGDRIITGKNSKATLIIDDDITIYVAENTRILISELIESSKAKSKSTLIDLQGGGIWTKIKKALNINSKFEIKTPTAVMGARGTEFYTSHYDGKTNISVLSGAVSITSYRTVPNEDGSTKQIILNVVLENNQHMTLETKPEELLDMVQEELTLEKLDLFALEIIKEIAENEPELVKPEFVEKIDEVIEAKKKEKMEKEEDEKKKEEEKDKGRKIEYDQQLQGNNYYSGGKGSHDNEKPIKFTVKFDSQGGSAVDAITVEKNTKINPPEDPVKEGYSFAGWYKDPECTTAWEFETDVVTSNITLYAKWEIKSYTVTFASPEGEIYTQVTVDYGSKVERPSDPVKEGYTFAGWYKDPECTTAWDFETDVITDNITLYAKWEIKSYTVTFASPEGEVYTQTTVEYGNKVEKPEDPVKEGYTFAGWYKDPECTTAWDSETDVITDNITLYAKWEIKSYTVTFASPEGEVYTQVTVDYGSKVEKPADPVKEGYSFAGWYKDPECTTAWEFETDVVTSNITLYAKWEIKSYTVTFASPAEGEVYLQVTVDYGSKVEKPEDPVKEGYTFAGWYKDPECTIAWDFETDVITDNIILYAKWELDIKPAVELFPETDLNFVNYDLRITFVPNDDFVNSIISVKVKHSNYSDEFIELEESVTWDDGDYYIDTDTEYYDGRYAIVLSLWNNKEELNIPGNLTVRIEATGYEVSEIEQIIFPEPSWYESFMEILLDGEPIDAEEMEYGNTYTVALTAMGIDRGNIVPIENMQFNLNIFVYTESDEYSFQIDGDSYSNGNYEHIPLKSKTDENGKVSFEITIPEDLPDHVEAFYIEIFYGKVPTLEMFGFYDIYFRYEDIP